jgi:hypothetical protein
MARNHRRNFNLFIRIRPVPSPDPFHVRDGSAGRKYPASQLLSLR